jgi:glutamate-1-semialdehyde 2,1-aminomutase
MEEILRREGETMSVNGSFLQKTKESARFHQEAAQFLPGGVTANIKYFEPYPIAMEAADGAYLYDLDRNRYIDYNLCYGALFWGMGIIRLSKRSKKCWTAWEPRFLERPTRLKLRWRKS